MSPPATQWPSGYRPSLAGCGGTLRCRRRFLSGNQGNLGMKILAWIIGIVFVTGLLVWLGIFKAIF
jgi:hypothetical protein